jgi:hypothetical protein
MLSASTVGFRQNNWNLRKISNYFKFTAAYSELTAFDAN